MMSSDDYTVKSLLETGKYTSVHSCKKCPYITKSMFLIRNHIRRHNNTNSLNLFDCAESTPEIFLCQECNFRTYYTTTFTNHLKDHTFQASGKNSRYQIRDVDKIIWPMYDLSPNKAVRKTSKQHRFYVDEKNVKWYYCDKCAYKTKQKSHLTDHIYNMHTSVENIQWFHCNECEYKAKREKALKSHMIFKHTSAEHRKWFYCDHCCYRTQNKQHLKRHMCNKSILRCEKCAYQTKYKSHLKNHIIEKHNPENIQWFCCDKCPFKVKRKCDLNYHIVANHTPPENIKWFHCDKCEYKAIRKRHLWYHVRNKHTPPEKWFHCDKCGYTTVRKNDLKRHVSTQHFSRRCQVVSLC